MVLDRVVGSSVEVFSNVGPPIFELAVLQEQDPLLLVAPIDLLYAGVQVVVPTLAALFALAARQLAGDSRPAHRPMLKHHLEHFFVFFFGPRTLD